VAELACYIAIEKAEMPVGKQDQYGAAFGGLNCITSSRDGVIVQPLQMPPGTREALENRVMLFFTGMSRQSSSILRRQEQANQEEDQAVACRLNAIQELESDMCVALEHGELDAFGDLLHQYWMERRELTVGTNPFLDQCYQAAQENGALGGKMTGAGDSGFMMLYCPEERQQAVTAALAKLGVQHYAFTFEDEGVQVMQATPWVRRYVSTCIPFALKGFA
jgi:D-glycero-alpha-D-manno-heptose-7-phosphate kinase